MYSESWITAREVNTSERWMKGWPQEERRAEEATRLAVLICADHPSGHSASSSSPHSRTLELILQEGSDFFKSVARQCLESKHIPSYDRSVEKKNMSSAR